MGITKCHLRLRLFVLLLGVPLFMSSCLWGIVTDARTGEPIGSASVTCTDPAGRSFSTTTDEHGLYSFNVKDGPVPATGRARFEVDAPKYGRFSGSRVIGYDDNASVSLSDPSSFWEVQSFSLTPGTQSIEVELASVDISSALMAADATTDYIVAMRCLRSG